MRIGARGMTTWLRLSGDEFQTVENTWHCKIKRLISRRFFHWQPRYQFMRSILCQHGSAHTSTKVRRIMNQRRANNGPSSLVAIVH